MLLEALCRAPGRRCTVLAPIRIWVFTRLRAPSHLPTVSVVSTVVRSPRLLDGRIIISDQKGDRVVAMKQVGGVMRASVGDV